MNFADQEEIAERQRRRGKKRRNDILWNSLTVVFAIATLAAIGYFLVLFANPASPANPYPPPTMPALIRIPTATLTPVVLPPTWTPTATQTNTPVATASATTPASSDQTPSSPTSIPAGNFLFSLKGNPVGMSNTTFHPTMDCNWQGVAGTITDIQGKPIDWLYIHITGTYNGKQIDQKTLSGGSDKMGAGGYEYVFEVGSQPVASSGQLGLQLEDSSGLALSPRIVFDTYADCGKNLVLINFQQAY